MLKDDVLKLVKAAGSAGVTALDLARMTGDAGGLNRITASLHGLTVEKAVRREKIAEEGQRAAFRYWYVRERLPYGLRVSTIGRKGGSTARPKAPDVLITLPLGGNQTVTCTLDEARAVFAQLSVLFSR